MKDVPEKSGAAQRRDKMTAKKEEITGLALLRQPFEEKQIGKLPKPTKKQTDEVKRDFKKGVRCQVCGGWHHKDVVHLDYVGHAALTDRLLDADPHWYWEPVAFTEHGLPAFDHTGGLWIWLYVHDKDQVIKRMGYGHAAESGFKEIGSREKEVIGDALRNAAMRFGAALDLWHKGDLHDDTEKNDKPKGSHKLDTQIRPFLSAILGSTSLEEFEAIKVEYSDPLSAINEAWPAYMKECQSEEQTKSFNQQIKEHKERLISREDIDKQQAKDLGEGDEDFVNPLS